MKLKFMWMTQGQLQFGPGITQQDPAAAHLPSCLSPIVSTTLILSLSCSTAGPAQNSETIQRITP